MPEVSQRTITLNNGVKIPIIGTGAWAPSDPEAQAKVPGWLCNALKNGYRHIDTAYIYGTEKATGEAIRSSGILREEVFITTKLPWHHHAMVRESLEESLNNIGTEYVDLYLMHWPQALVHEDGNMFPQNADGTYKAIPDVKFHEIWADMENLLETGKVRAIGVSNFSIKTLEQLLTRAKVVPAVNQVELHPYLAQNALRDYCTKKGIALMAYAPSGFSDVRSDPVIGGIAAKYGVTSNQVTLAWHISRNTLIIPKSENHERQLENINVPTISPVDLEKVWALDRGQRVCNKPDSVHNQIWGWTPEQLGW